MSADTGGEQARDAERAKVIEVFSELYTIHETLPWGGLATYFHAEEAGRDVVVAVLPVNAGQAPSFEGAFSLGAGAIEAIESPLLLACTDYGVQKGIPYIEYEYKPGTLLANMLQHGPLESLDLLKIADNVIRGVHAGHAQDIFHGDLNPNNILVYTGEDGPEAKIIGMGISQLIQAGRRADSDAPIGSGPWAEEYAAPEVYRGQASFRSDIYAAGVLIHHMVVGSPPTGYDSTDAFEDIPDLPTIVKRATARNPHERYESGLTMAAGLDWLEVLSSNMSPHTQDIPLWMENSMVGSIPVPKINVPMLAGLPDALGQSKPPMPMPRVEDEVISLDGEIEAMSPDLITTIPAPASRGSLGPPGPLSNPSIPVPQPAPQGESSTLMLAAVALLLIILSILGMMLFRFKRGGATNGDTNPAVSAPADPAAGAQP